MESTTSYTFSVQTGGIFYFPWYRHQIEGTNGFQCLIRKTQRYTISNEDSLARFLHLIITPGPSGIRTPVGGVISGRANHYTTAYKEIMNDICTDSSVIVRLHKDKSKIIPINVNNVLIENVEGYIGPIEPTWESTTASRQRKES